MIHPTTTVTMKTTNGDFKALVHSALRKTRVGDLLASGSAVVLERIAMGGGATDWYYCDGTSALEIVERKLSPGSAVTFYFDDRIRRSPKSPEVAAELARIIDETRGAMVGVLGEDGVEIEAEMLVGRIDLAEYMSALPTTSVLFYGEFPGRDNDGTRAITVILPDRDGIVRAHPY